jgi:nucleotide-binding universal stress UspA family protein
VWNRLLFAIDQFPSGRTALDFVTGFSQAHGSEVRVLHILEVPRLARVPPMESPAEAERVVEDAVLTLRLAGIGAEGRARAGPAHEVAQRIVEEPLFWECDGIVLGSRRLHGMARLSGQGVRERVLRLSWLPVLIAPTPVPRGLVHPLGPPHRAGHPEDAP